MERLGDLQSAEQEYLASASLAPDPANWTRLAELYEREHKVPQAIASRKKEIELSTNRVFVPILSLGFEYLNASQPREALDAFDRSQTSFQREDGGAIELHKPFYATLAHGRAMAWKALGNIKQAVALEEQAAQLTPERQDVWSELAALYELQGRSDDAERARNRAAELSVR